MDFKQLEFVLAMLCRHYEKTAPTVEAWADDLYRRMTCNPDSVRLSEVMLAVDLSACDLQPNYAANKVYKLMSRLGQDTTGHAGF